MPTAIFRYLTNSGFVIAADGRITGGDDEAQKIFEIKGAPAAYALYGNIGIGDWREDAPVALDLGLEAKKFIESGSNKLLSDCVGFAQDLADELYSLLLKLKDQGVIPRYDGFLEYGDGSLSIAHIFLFGYSNDAPAEVDILFSHRDQALRKPLLYPFGFRRSNPHAWGAEKLYRLMFEFDDPALTKFRRLRIPSPPEEISLEGAATIGEDYILACESDEGRRLDPFCSNIGGEIHIAEIEPRGFNWRKRPISLSVPARHERIAAMKTGDQMWYAPNEADDGQKVTIVSLEGKTQAVIRLADGTQLAVDTAMLTPLGHR
jgi:hypothetical protein